MGFDLQVRGEMIAELVYQTLAAAQQNAPRTLQSTKRVLGLSEIGGCREYIRASITGERKDPEPFKWSAFVGTALGDYVEGIMARDSDATTQEVVTVTLPRTKIEATGHLDMRWSSTDDLVDLKTRDKEGMAEVRRDGPPFKNQAQLACYFKALVDAGKMTTDGFAHLMYLDRSGKDDNFYTWTIDWERALLIIDALEDRLLDVAGAISRGDYFATRDEPQTYCQNIGCPFAWRCWEGYLPSNKITHPEEIRKIDEFDAARSEAEEANKYRQAKRDACEGISGTLPDGRVAEWKIIDSPHGPSTRFNLYPAPKNPKKEKAS